MLAGLLFATHDAADRPDALTATLPFAGTTLIEHQARSLIELGASHLIIVIARLTPELLGAVSRIGRRGIAIDPVRSAAEAAEKAHPRGRLLVLADGLIASVDTIAALAGEGGDALMVTPAANAPPGFERVGGAAAWAGVARLAPARLADVARLPRDYDIQSALLRVAEQARATHVLLPAGALATGHGIEQHAAALAERGRALLSASLSRPAPWFDRWVVAPLARLLLPRLLERGTPSAALAGAGGALALSGIAAMTLDHAALGLCLMLAACVPLAMGVSLSRFREEPRFARAQEAALAILCIAGAVLLGRSVERFTGDRAPLVLALVLVAAGALAERAATGPRRRGWWAAPPALLAVLGVFTAAGWPTLGLTIAACYAAVSLEAAIEALRRQA